MRNHFSSLRSPTQTVADRKQTRSVLQIYCSRLLTSVDFQPSFPGKQILLSYVGSFIGIAMLAYLTYGTHYPLIAAPFGATAVLAFAVPESPLAQPRNMVAGNFLSAIVAVILIHLFGTAPWVMALAVATAIKVMQLTKTLHPPGGAVALVSVMSNASWSFPFAPVLAGSLIMLGCTFLFNNFIAEKPYPKHWI